jgi:hypothetical protein
VIWVFRKSDSDKLLFWINTLMEINWPILIFFLLFRFAEIGVLYWRLDPKKSESEEGLAEIRKERGYNYMVCPHFMYTFFSPVCSLLYVISFV